MLYTAGHLINDDRKQTHNKLTYLNMNNKLHEFFLDCHFIEESFGPCFVLMNKKVCFHFLMKLRIDLDKDDSVAKALSPKVVHDTQNHDS